MIVIHGLFANKTSLKALINQDSILDKRDCYCIDMRNGLYSDYHESNSYELFAADIIRFADKNGIEKFDVLGHSMGGRTALTLACVYPDRIDGCISMDAGPIKKAGKAF